MKVSSKWWHFRFSDRELYSFLTFIIFPIWYRKYHQRQMLQTVTEYGITLTRMHFHFYITMTLYTYRTPTLLDKRSHQLTREPVSFAYTSIVVNWGQVFAAHLPVSNVNTPYCHSMNTPYYHPIPQLRGETSTAVKDRHWKPSVVRMPTLPSLFALQIGLNSYNQSWHHGNSRFHWISIILRQKSVYGRDWNFQY